MGVLNAIIGGASSLAGAGIDAKTQKEINAANIRAQQEMNATNILAAKASQERSRKYALEDREYNSEHSQYQRLLSLGMSPAMAMQAVSGAQSNLSSIDTSMPQQQAYMQQYSPVWASAFGHAGDLLAHSTAALEQKYFQDKQFAHDEKMFNMQVEEQKRQENQRLIKEKYGYKEYSQQNDIVSSLFNEIRGYFRDNDISIAGMSRDDIETKLQASNKELYDKLQSVTSNACANEIFDDLSDRNQLQSITGQDYTSKDLQNDIMKIDKQIRGLDLYKAGIDAKNYPALSKLLMKIQKRELSIRDLTIQDMKEDFDFKQAAHEVEKLKLQIEKDKALKKHGKANYGDKFTNATANTLFEIAENLGLLIENLGSAIGLIKM